jgi:hypothetical protein
VNIDYVTQTADDGTETKAIQQIELSYDDSSSVSIVDLNGERRVDLSGGAQNAILNNLKDSTVNPVFLANGASAATMTYELLTDANGNSVQSLLTIALTIPDDSGNQTTLTFDRDGASLNTPAQFPDTPFPESRPLAPRPTPAPEAVKTLQQKMDGSETFRALKSNFGWQ